MVYRVATFCAFFFLLGFTLSGLLPNVAALIWGR